MWKWRPINCKFAPESNFIAGDSFAVSPAITLWTWFMTVVIVVQSVCEFIRFIW